MHGLHACIHASAMHLPCLTLSNAGAGCYGDNAGIPGSPGDLGLPVLLMDPQEAATHRLVPQVRPELGQGDRTFNVQVGDNGILSVLHM